jgi:ribosomal-protein-alanine N-acetyltransferase
VDTARQIEAYICFRLIAGEMHILKIAVRFEGREQGVASWLLNQSLQIALKHKTVAVYLETRITNKAALKLYHAHGFEVVGKRPAYYADNREDALIMMKKLKEGV